LSQLVRSIYRKHLEAKWNGAKSPKAVWERQGPKLASNAPPVWWFGSSISGIGWSKDGHKNTYNIKTHKKKHHRNVEKS